MAVTHAHEDVPTSQARVGRVRVAEAAARLLVAGHAGDQRPQAVVEVRLQRVPAQSTQLRLPIAIAGTNGGGARDTE
eukprot:2462506-Prymnesium_polylepis.1